MTAFANHFAFEFKTGLRNPTQLLMNYLFPLGFYVMMGLVMTQINPLFAATMVPAMAIVAGLSSAVLGLPGTLVESRQAGIYRSFKINGVPALSILAIPAITTLFQVVLVTTVITLTAPLFKGAQPINWGAFALVTLVMAFAFGAIGSLIGVVSNDSRSTVLFSQLIFLPAMLLGGLMLPVDMLPASVRSISALLPATHAMQAYQGLAFGQTTVIDPTTSLLVLLASGLLAFALSIYLFSWDSQNSARRGHPALALLALAPFVAAMVLM
jgi:ABC-2 type transport system permease protein